MLNMCAFIFTKSMVIGVKSCICTYFLHDLNNCEKCQPPNVEHRFVNTGDEPLWITWTLSPPGFEKQIRKISDGTAGMEVFSKS